jgi:hypothetical protein
VQDLPRRRQRDDRLPWDNASADERCAIRPPGMEGGAFRHRSYRRLAKPLRILLKPAIRPLRLGADHGIYITVGLKPLTVLDGEFGRLSVCLRWKLQHEVAR